MKFYAKSKRHKLKQEDKEQIQIEYLHLIETMKISLSENEITALKRERDTLINAEEEEQKTLKEHLEETVRCAQSFLEKYGSYFTEKEKYLICTACKCHDFGKANLIFQSLISDEKQEKYHNIKQIPHGFLSALTLSLKELQEECNDITKDDFKCLVTAVYYHHTRDDEYKDSDIRAFSDQYFESCYNEFCENGKWKTQMRNRSFLLFRNSAVQMQTTIKDDLWQEYMLIKGMLNKFDWTVSSGKSESEEKADFEKKELIKHIQNKYGENLRTVQKYMKEKTDYSVVIVAPTGSGKTEAALYWLNGEKGFYTLPLKVSSNAIYKRIREEYQFNDVALLHSESLQKYIEESGSEEQNEHGKTDVDQKAMLAKEKLEKAKMFNAPLMVTTVDQLFLFVYKALGTEMMAATLKYSKVIIDEIQSYEPRVVAALIYGLKTISQMGGKFAVITATLPPVLLDYMERYGLAKDKAFCFADFSQESVLRRHMIAIYEQEFDLEEIIEEANTKKVLVICNTVRKAQEMYCALAEQIDNVYSLHANYIRKHRKMLEENIMRFSEGKGNTGVWITTQIVEASMDIDFDVLYTEMCTADSLLQRMGRCNRKGRYVPHEPNIRIYKTENAKKLTKNKTESRGIYYKDLFERSWEYLLTYEKTTFTEAQKTKYINEVYNADEITNTEYYKEIEEYLEYFEGLSINELSKREVQKKFRMIKSISVIPDEIYNENQEFIENYQEIICARYLGQEAKAILNSKLNELTLSVTLYNRGSWIGIDKDVIKNTDIHRSMYEYVFDENTGKGIGLSRKTMEDDFMM